MSLWVGGREGKDGDVDVGEPERDWKGDEVTDGAPKVTSIIVGILATLHL